MLRGSPERSRVNTWILWKTSFFHKTICGVLKVCTRSTFRKPSRPRGVPWASCGACPRPVHTSPGSPAPPPPIHPPSAETSWLVRGWARVPGFSPSACCVRGSFPCSLHPAFLPARHRVELPYVAEHVLGCSPAAGWALGSRSTRAAAQRRCDPSRTFLRELKPC